MNLTLRDYQIENAKKALDILKSFNLVYLAMEVRCGKTATSFEICRLFGAKKVLFLTKKKALKSIESDYREFLYKEHFDIVIINDESMHTIKDNDFDIVIHDEHHRFSAIPKPGKYTKIFKERYSKLPMIFLSGTPTPETKMQWYHQFWVSDYSPFKQHIFYKWFSDWGFVKKEFEHGFGKTNNYQSTLEVIQKYYAVQKRKLSKNDEDYQNKVNNLNRLQEIDERIQKETEKKLEDFVKPYLITYTQKESGFEVSVQEKIHKVKMKDSTYKVAGILRKKNIVKGNEEVILADTAVKLMSKLLQIFSGTVIFESGEFRVLDDSKIEYIKTQFKGKRLAIFYKFKAEWLMIKNAFGDDICEDINSFDHGVKHIALQYLSGREGVSLRNADELIFLTPDFSATTYFQARDRLSYLGRKENTLHWILSDKGIDNNVYKSVINKKSYTLSIFKKDKLNF